MADIGMPRLSDTMEEGTILKWLRASGDEVRRGDELVEIETDKAAMTYEADADGLLEILAEEGATLPIGAVIASIDTGRPAAAGSTEAPEPSTAAAAPPHPEPAPRAPASVQGDSGITASPLETRVAGQHIVDLPGTAGTGPAERILRADVEGAQSTAPSLGPDPLTAKGDVTTIELTRKQELVARRMAQAKATIPEFMLGVEIEMGRCVDLRARLRELRRDEALPSYNDMIVKACALALRKHPRANGSFRNGRFELYSRINIGVAVAAEDALIVPTVFDADRKGLDEIASETHALAERVRSGTITPPELSGGTFTVSNLGMFGVSRFTAVINPPQAAILAAGAIAPRAVERDGQLVLRQMLDVSLTCDHRILYGAEAGRFLATVRALLEESILAL